eukprot:CAMPEP_0171462714 /NCGR_PEP_ID=MMETSP0945-20130129/6635_1 /TAXON_ID=109269 /ORGANISM="Vaucheria litorea, Strain CCMP2940" /LENGTH=259 /DNA_ID=CAMNT_0011989283 /DNA_START=454 /DNA_END=1233 /DNA_ORIENTATION=+
MRRDFSSQMQWEEEIRMMRLAQGHRNCIRLIDLFEDRDGYYIVMEFAPGGELFRKLQTNGKFSENEAAKIVSEVLQAVEHLHSLGIIHFDIKPENIIMRDCQNGKAPQVKLADFGSAFLKYHISPLREYTLSYSAPEVLQKCSVIDEKADIWSVGVLMYLLLSGSHPFQYAYKYGEEEMKKMIIAEGPDFTSSQLRHISPEAKNLLRRMLSNDRNKRPSASEALSHSWFSPAASTLNDISAKDTNEASMSISNLATATL